MTQQDIARLTGVSQATVSLVLNGRTDADVRIAPETRDRVLRAIQDTGYVAECVTRAIDILLYAHGAGSFADVSPLQRIWRDSATAARHAVVSPQVSYEVYGKALLGVEDTITPLI